MFPGYMDPQSLDVSVAPIKGGASCVMHARPVSDAGCTKDVLRLLGRMASCAVVSSPCGPQHAGGEGKGDTECRFHRRFTAVGGFRGWKNGTDPLCGKPPEKNYVLCDVLVRFDNRNSLPASFLLSILNLLTNAFGLLFPCLLRSQPNPTQPASAQARWFLGFLAIESDDTSIYCVSQEPPASGHPSTATWNCECFIHLVIGHVPSVCFCWNASPT